jgi:hypothetical protein
MKLDELQLPQFWRFNMEFRSKSFLDCTIYAETTPSKSRDWAFVLRITVAGDVSQFGVPGSVPDWEERSSRFCVVVRDRFGTSHNFPVSQMSRLFIGKERGDHRIGEYRLKARFVEIGPDDLASVLLRFGNAQVELLPAN